jgi:hypothetical protein
MKRNEKRRADFFLITFIISLIGVVPLIFGLSDEDWIYPLAFLCFVISVISFICYLIYRNRARVESKDFVEANLLADWKTDEYEAQIYKRGIVLDGEMYLWGSYDSDIVGVGLHPHNSNVLVFDYKLLAGGRPSRRRHIIELSIPEGEELAAEKVIYTYNKPLPTDFSLIHLGLTEEDSWDDGDVDIEETKRVKL